MGAPPNVAIVDYGLGNLFSVGRACEHAGLNAVVTSRAEDLEAADAILLPGVGAFADAMVALGERRLIEPLKSLADGGKPFIGVCLGLQLLMSVSHEFGTHEGLGLIEGAVNRLPAEKAVSPAFGRRRLKVPQVGWSPVYPPRPGAWDRSLLDGIDGGTPMYFVHSYYVEPADPAIVLSVSRFGDFEFCSSLRWRNIFACQFHPERSGREGIRLYANMFRLLSQGWLQ